MNGQNKLFDTIERYLNGSLPEAERKSFEQRLSKDPELSKQVSLQRVERETMEFLVAEDLKKKLTLWGEHHSPNPPQLKLSKSLWKSIIILLLIGFLVVLGI